jgi:recombinational DNA repair ATPase RecF
MNATRPPSIPIGLKSIKIENFRGIDSLELSFLDAFGNASDVIVLVGPNGCGKTTVLEACLFIAGHSYLLRGANLHRDGFLRQAVRVGTTGFHIVAEVQKSEELYILDTEKIGFFVSDWHLAH